MSTGVRTASVPLSSRSEAELWLEGLARLLDGGDPAMAAALFHDDGWWRDLLAFGWDFRSIHGREGIGDHAARAARHGAREFALRPEIPPGLVQFAGREVLEAHFCFETPVVRAIGIARLTRDDDSGSWKAWIVFTAADELIGHEEAIGRRRPFGAPRGPRDTPEPTWTELRRDAVAYEGRDPDVLVLGAGHSGLGIAARLGRLGVDALIVERNAAVGDNWRNRYESLVLHDPVWNDHLPYLEFPPSWPVYTPKGLLADWLESYAKVMELNVWTGSEIDSCSYDDAIGRWAIDVRRADGRIRTLHPAHLVFATGTSGTEPRIPDLAGRDEFAGRVIHSSEYVDGKDARGLTAVVVGTGTSGHDIAQNLHEYGARVTMLQRTSTYVVDTSRSYLTEADRAPLSRLHSEGGPGTDFADLLSASAPYLAMKQATRDGVERQAQVDSGLLDGLRAAGFATDSGPGGAGLAGLYFERGGGYYQNVGASDLIVQGKIAVKSGAGIERFSRTGLVLTDGTELDADLVVLATGFRLMGDTIRSVVGPAEAARCGPVWGIDPEGELRSMWRPTGHPGLWLTGANLAFSRYYGRLLALQLKARLEGLVDDDKERR